MLDHAVAALEAGEAVGPSTEAYVLERLDAFICAADVVTLDGHVVNKIGTYQIALAAHENGIPFYGISMPLADNPPLIPLPSRNATFR